MNAYKMQAESDCMLACIATLLQKPIAELWSQEFRERIEEKRGTRGEDVDEAFRLAGLSKETDYWTVYIPPGMGADPSLKRLLSGRRAFLQVPSLNRPDDWHIIYWAGETLYDPSNKQVYRWISQCAPAYVWVFDETRRRF